ncbi:MULTISPECIES: type VII secretion-associated protein [Corynebacterium]|uniref:type VII secretion-associated protein n=1 Tax=Corynebacterium TaxID=1716 RepID=UPI0008A995DE|nr:MULTISPECIES: type VII secretion-associated protein [unclassified Corynebacterium]MDK8828889.1 type VII secretion-associated protein [Corynebacterium sp. MSK012]OHQ63102.1 type VII secretion-associated protein [Corynebacterium sp. HMSC072B08]
MIRVDSPDTTQTPTLRHGTWHLWGLAAPADTTELAVHGPRPLLESMQTVIVPSYWGAVRQCRLASALLAAELNPYILTLADAVVELDEATVSHSVLVEVEETRVCVTRLSGGHIASRMTHLVGANDSAPLVETVIALAYQLTMYPDAPQGIPDDVEVSGGRGITEYPPRWQEDIEFIVGEVPPGLANPRRALLVDRLRDRGFLVFDCPASRLGECVNPAWLKNIGDAEVGEVERSEDFAGRRPAARAEVNSASKQSTVVSVAAVGLLTLVVLIVGIAAWLVSGGIASENEGRQKQRETSHAQAAPVTTPPVTKPPPTSKPVPDSAPIVKLTNAGVEARFPGGWELDSASPLDRLIAVDGGDMRVLVLASPLSQDMALEHLAAALSSSVAGDETKSAPERRQVLGTDVVVVEERLPSGNSIVLWHHKVMDGTQVSVGCQFRGRTIAPVRPVCDQAVVSARPVP